MHEFTRFLFTALLLTSPALAQTRVPGTWVGYSVSQDPITDVNIGAGTALPTVTLRIGSAPAQTIYPQQLSETRSANDNSLPNSVAFPAGITRQMAAGLYAGQRVVLRLERSRSAGAQVLTYTFPADGSQAAWNAVNRCQPLGQTASAPVAAATGEAPRFKQWYFTNCTEEKSGAVPSQLRAGQLHRCSLVIETIPNGATPVSTVFSFELEYTQDGRNGKITLDDRDVWQAGGVSGPVSLRTEGSRLIFTLPLNVRSRADRRYTSINVSGTIHFSNGGSKRVYEKLPVER